MGTFCRFVAVLALLSVLIACSSIGHGGGLQGSGSRAVMQVTDLRVKPFLEKDLLRVNSLAIAPIVTTPQASLNSGQERELHQQLASTWGAELALKLVDLESVRQAYTRQHAGTARDRARAMGQDLGVDTVLIPTVTHFEQRVGSRVGGTRPAGIGFVLSLVHVTDGQELLGFEYFRRDQALSENLLRVGDVLERGLGWQTAEALFVEGVRKSARKFAKLRNREFAKQR